MQTKATLTSALTLGILLPTAFKLAAQQPVWSQVASVKTPDVTNLGNEILSAIASDGLRGRVVLFQVQDTWEWDGVAWTAMHPPTAPLTRLDFAIACDSRRGQTVLFGGVSGNHKLADTWEWDGSSWSQRTPAHSPPPRANHAMVYDRQRQCVFLFGGEDDFVRRSDNWQWNGIDWIERPSIHAPTPRIRHAMAYDAARARVVLFGGSDGQLNGETWEWDGADWTAMVPAHAPSPRIDPALAFDAVRGRTVLCGGSNQVGTFSATWLWDGTDWTDITPAGLAPESNLNLLAYDDARGQSLLLRGLRTWTLGPAGWSPHPELLAQHGRAALAYDSVRGRTVMFGSLLLDDTWEWNGMQWILRLPPLAPSPRSGHRMDYDRAHRRTVLFGGTLGVNVTTPGNLLGDTWEWDGEAWTQRSPAHAPSPRFSHNMAYDSRRAVVLLFGGFDGGMDRSDAWEWNGTDWTPRLSAHAPTPREGHAMTYDAIRDRVVLFGGLTFPSFPVQYWNDTWEWDGTDWLAQNPAHSPPSFAGAAMAFHEPTRNVVLLDDPIGGTWEWNGNDWTLAPIAMNDVGYAMAYDEQRGRIVLQGTIDGETFEYGIPGAAVAATYAAGCGSPELAAAPTPSSRPILGQTQTIDIGNVPAGSVFMNYGWSNTAAGPFALPFALDLLGMPGCELFESVDMLAQPCTATGPGTAQHAVPIPNLPYLLGAHIWLQAWAPAPGQNPAGLIVSNGLSLFLGSS